MPLDPTKGRGLLETLIRRSGALAPGVARRSHAQAPGSTVRVTVEIEAEIPDGVPDDVQRIVNENAQTLRLKAHGFEKS